jgi:hypothetical protein
MRIFSKRVLVVGMNQQFLDFWFWNFVIGSMVRGVA